MDIERVEDYNEIAELWFDEDDAATAENYVKKCAGIIKGIEIPSMPRVSIFFQ